MTFNIFLKCINFINGSAFNNSMQITQVCYIIQKSAIRWNVFRPRMLMFYKFNFLASDE